LEDRLVSTATSLLGGERTDRFLADTALLPELFGDTATEGTVFSKMADLENGGDGVSGAGAVEPPPPAETDAELTARFERDAMAEFFEALDQGSLEMFLIQFVEVVQPQIAVEFAGDGKRVDRH